MQAKQATEIKSILRGPVYVYNPETYEPTTEPALDPNGNQIVLTKSITLDTPNDVQLGVGDDIEGYNQGYRSVKFFSSMTISKTAETSQMTILFPLCRYFAD